MSDRQHNVAWLASTVLLLAAVLGPPHNRFLQSCLFFALCVTFGAAGDRLARRALGTLAGPSRLAAAFTLASALAIAMMTVCGAVGLMRREALYAAGALVAVALVWGRPGNSSPEERRLDPGWIPILIALAIVGAAEWGMPDPPGSRHYDDTLYHLPAIATWRASHDLSTLKFAFGDPSTTFYPVAGEIFGWILLAPFDDSDVLARWSQLPFALASLATIVSIGRRLGLSPLAAGLSALAFVTSPRVVPALALSAGNDHVMSFFLLAAVDAMLAFAAAPGAGPATVLGVALGLAAGTKYAGLFGAGAVFVAVLALARKGSRRWLAASFALAMAIGGYSYLRNLWTVGNPVFPQPLTVAGVEILPGWPQTGLEMRRSSDAAALHPGQIPHFLWDRTDLFGPVFRWITLPAFALALLCALGRRRLLPRVRWSWTVVLALALAWFLLFAYLLHDHRDVRYVFHALALSGLGIGFLFDWRRRTWREADWPRLRAIPQPVLWAGALVAATALAAATTEYQRRKFDRAPVAVRRFDELTSATGATVAYLGSNQPYWFWGSRLQNRVEIVPTNGPAAERFYRWGAGEFSHDAAKFRTWSHNLDNLDVEYIVVARRDDSPEPVERQWMARRPARFEFLFADPTAEIWRVRG